MDFHTFGSTALVDATQLVVKDLKDVGIDVKLNQKEYGAFVLQHRRRQPLLPLGLDCWPDGLPHATPSPERRRDPQPRRSKRRERA